MNQKTEKNRKNRFSGSGSVPKLDLKSNMGSVSHPIDKSYGKSAIHIKFFETNQRHCRRMLIHSIRTNIKLGS